MLCKTCVKTKNFSSAGKAKHKPKCQAGHNWKNEAELCVANECKELYYFADMCVSPTETTSFDEQIIVSINEIKNRFKIRGDKVMTLSEKPAKKPQRCENNSDSNNIFIEDTEQFNKILLYDDSDEEDSVDNELNDVYYELKPVEEALMKREQDPKHFKLCKLKLEGTYEATATPVDEDSSAIQINGRMNCGPCFDGDEVIVEIKNVRKLDAETYVRRGKVIAIFKKVQPRTNATFICSPDDFQSNLMKPLCGTVPKIHLVDAVVCKKRETLKGIALLLYMK